MIKLKAFCTLLLCTGILQFSIAQTSVNKVSHLPGNESAPPDFINGISFTPNGILQTTESGGSKNIKATAAPVVIKSNEDKKTEEPASLIETLSGIQYKYAMLLNVEVESLKNITLLGLIDNWLGTRYRMGGTTKDGIDCSALTGTLLMAVYGFAMPRTAKMQYKASHHIKKNELQEGDLVFFNMHGGVSHVGLYLDNNYFVHASSSEGVTISNLEDHYYSKRFICGGRVTE